MTRVRIDLNISLDGYVAGEVTSDHPMGRGWDRLTAAYVGTRTMQARVFGRTDGAGTTGVDDAYAAAYHDGIGAEVMGAAMFGLHSHPDDPDWTGWWGDHPPFECPVFVLTHTAPRPPVEMAGGTTFHFRSAPIHDVLAEAREAAGDADVRVGGGASTARAFLAAGLVDRLHVAVAPVLLGGGTRFWDGLAGLDATHDVSVEVAESGVSHVTYTRKAGDR